MFDSFVSYITEVHASLIPARRPHRQIQMFLGHMNIRTTETYLHELDMDRDIVDAFDDPEKDGKAIKNQ